MAEPAEKGPEPSPPAGPPGMPPPPPPSSPLPHWPELRGRPFDRLTERAKRALFVAHEEAQRYKHNYAGTEHLLLGVVSVEDGVAARVLSTLGLERSKIRETVEFRIGRGDRAVSGEVTLTPRAKTALQLAVDEAGLMNHSHVGTEHLLLGLLREGSGIAAGVLTSLDLRLDQIRSQVIQLIASRPASAEEAPAVRSNVITCRIDDRDLAAIDTVIEAGVRTTRSEAASWLIHAGIEANRALFDEIEGTVTQVRRLRHQAHQLAQQAMGRVAAQAGAMASGTRAREPSSSGTSNDSAG